MKITQHIPAYVETGDEPRRTAEVSSREELLAIPWVARWAEDFTRSEYYVSDNRLMIDGQRDSRRSWVVIGFLSEPTNWFAPWPGGGP